MNTTNHFFELLWAMTEKELRARYKYTVFGFLWLVANPILQMLVIGFVFTFFMKAPLDHYYYYLFVGLLIWNFFSLSLSKATPSIVFERSLVKKASFPRAIIPLSIVASNAFHFIIAFLLYLVPLAFIGTFSLYRIPHLILGLVLLGVFTVGISLLTSALNVRFRDVNFFVQAILTIWFYATPIMYSLTQIPPRLLWLWRFNPLTAILQLIQYALLDTPGPGIGMLISNVTVIIILVFVGVKTFEKENKTFDDWL
jgi:ABC-type polysaccharide/polyol phosphate export permease